ncbi:hypothetical protein [Acidithiobacillus thiooxidans]|uniref:hypothetical protein n=1 Tax=Acidithiobacillus thiooxidans TaxID=930 RepID=UPI000467CD93|nr:hypothetical protein [Acidithiobacillus thiooxidans]
MSHLLDRLKYLVRYHESFSDGHGVKLQDDRLWEDAYRHRWRYDKVVRTTHGVNCTGGCSWNVHVKNGLVVFEMQAHDYPKRAQTYPTTNLAVVNEVPVFPGIYIVLIVSNTP